MSEWRRTPSRNASEARGGRRCAPCGARERERRAAERAEAGDSGAERGEGTGQRDSIADGTALRCGRVGSRHFQSPSSLR